jgi:hypothetical protein
VRGAPGSRRHARRSAVRAAGSRAPSARRGGRDGICRRARMGTPSGVRTNRIRMPDAPAPLSIFSAKNQGECLGGVIKRRIFAA